LKMPEDNENRVAKDKGVSTPEDQGEVTEKGVSSPSEIKELSLSPDDVKPTWTKAEEAALVRRLGMLDPTHGAQDLRIMPLVTFIYLCNFIECVYLLFIPAVILCEWSPQCQQLAVSEGPTTSLCICIQECFDGSA